MIDFTELQSPTQVVEATASRRYSHVSMQNERWTFQSRELRHLGHQALFVLSALEKLSSGHEDSTCEFGPTP